MVQVGSLLSTQFSFPLGPSTTETATRQLAQQQPAPSNSVHSPCAPDGRQAGSSEMPVDWSLKTVLHISSSSPVACCMDALNVTGAQGKPCCPAKGP